VDEGDPTGARMMACDQQAKNACVVTGEFTMIPPASGPGAPRTVFFPDTFGVLTYGVKERVYEDCRAGTHDLRSLGKSPYPDVTVRRSRWHSGRTRRGSAHAAAAPQAARANALVGAARGDETEIPPRVSIAMGPYVLGITGRPLPACPRSWID